MLLDGYFVTDVQTKEICGNFLATLNLLLNEGLERHGVNRSLAGGAKRREDFHQLGDLRILAFAEGGLDLILDERIVTMLAEPGKCSLLKFIFDGSSVELLHDKLLTSDKLDFGDAHFDHHIGNQLLNDEVEAFLLGFESSFIELDVADEGYRTITHWFDELIRTFERLHIEYETVGKKAQQPSDDMDLFGWSERDSLVPLSFTDTINHAAEHCVTIFCSSPRQFRTARLIMHLHLIDKFAQSSARFHGFPNLGTAFKRRPNVLEADRRKIFQPQQREAEWEVI